MRSCGCEIVSLLRSPRALKECSVQRRHGSDGKDVTGTVIAAGKSIKFRSMIVRNKPSVLTMTGSNLISVVGSLRPPSSLKHFKATRVLSSPVYAKSKECGKRDTQSYIVSLITVVAFRRHTAQ